MRLSIINYTYTYFFPANPSLTFSSFHCQSKSFRFTPVEKLSSQSYGTLTREPAPPYKYITPVRALFLNYSPRVFAIRLSINSSLPSPPCRRRSFLLPNDPQIRPERTQAPPPLTGLGRDLSVNLFYTISVSVQPRPSRFEHPNPIQKLNHTRLLGGRKD